MHGYVLVGSMFISLKIDTNVTGYDDVTHKKLYSGIEDRTLDGSVTNHRQTYSVKENPLAKSIN